MPTKKKPKAKPRGRPFAPGNTAWKAPKKVPGESNESPELPLAVQVCRDWLEQNGVELPDPAKESVWVPTGSNGILADPPDDPKVLVRFRMVLNARGAEDTDFRNSVIRRCTGSGLTDVQALVYFTKIFIWQNNAALKGREVGPFIPWPYQVEGWKEIVETLLAPNENWEREDMAAEKSRELGATQAILILLVWVCACHRHKRVLAMSHTEKAVKESKNEDTHFGKIEFMLDRTPEWFRRGAEKKGGIIRFPGTASQIAGQATTVRAGVSNRFVLVFLDEFSKWANAEEIWAQLASTGNRLACGTHYGVGNQFHYLTQGSGRIRKVVWHWSQHPIFRKGLYKVTDGKLAFLDPGYVYPAQCPKCSRLQARVQVGDPTKCCGLPAREYKFVTDGTPSGGPYPGVRSPWYDRECVRRADPREVASHLDINPQGGVHQVFDELIVHELRKKAKPPLWEGEVEDGKLVARAFGRLKLWVHPNPRGLVPFGKYGCGNDIAQGTGKTPSCLSIYDASLCRRVASYVNPRIDARAFADLSVALCNIFRTKDGTGALLAWEVNGPGVQFGDRVMELGYRNVYCGDDVAPRMYAHKRSDRPGWNSGASGAIQTLIETYRWAIQSGTLSEYDDETLKETLNYRYNALGIPEHPERKAKNDPSGASANHGDRVVSAALGWKTVKELGDGVPQEPDEQQGPAVGTWLWRREQAIKQDREAEVWV